MFVFIEASSQKLLHCHRVRGVLGWRLGAVIDIDLGHFFATKLMFHVGAELACAAIGTRLACYCISVPVGTECFLLLCVMVPLGASMSEGANT